MKFAELKSKILSLFEQEKLNAKPEEWGFNNETDEDIKKLAFAVNLTPETVSGAARENAQILITHHDAWDFVYGMKEECLKLLRNNNIAHAFFHAPLDDADFGTSASLAKAMGIKNLKKVIPYAGIFLCGVAGEVEGGISFEELSKKLSSVLNEPIRAYKNSDEPIRKICITTGGGNMTDTIKAAVDEKCGAYITGEYNLYSQQYAKFAKINLLTGSHTNTEILGVQALSEKIAEIAGIALVKIKEENY